MYFFLILFFISLFGIALMIGRRLLLANYNQDQNFDDLFLKESFSLNEIRQQAFKKSKKYGFIALVITIRIYVKSSHLLKNGYGQAKDKTGKLIHKYLSRKGKEKKEKEVSSFLKMVTDYKHRIRQIKHRIKEEEGIE